MLIKFESTAACAPFVMLEEDAKSLLRAMGQSDTLEGAVSGEQLQAALAHLEQALANECVEAKERKSAYDDAQQDEDEHSDEVAVKAGARAAPLIDMLRKAKADDDSVMWKPE